jgi:3-phosphoglycerate kinase
MKKLTIEELKLNNKKVLMRVDFNVPLDDEQHITDDTRILAALPSIKHVLKKGANLILMSHLGRPKGKVDEKLSLKPVAKRLGELLNKEITMAPDCIGEAVEKIVEAMEEDDIVLLENLRFHPGEKGNDPEFAKQLANLGDVYVNDAFGTCHRAHASMVGVTEYLDTCAAGFLLEKEIKYLSEKLKEPEKPYVAILGGAKISGKIDVIQNLMDKVDSLLIGGGMMFTFLHAKGLEIGKSLLEEDRVEMAKEIMKKVEEQKFDLVLPEDTVIADAFENDANRRTVSVEEIPPEWMGLDIGEKTIEKFSKIIKNASTIVWNGPMGVAEMENFAHGTEAIATAVARATETGAISILGGGDTGAIVNKLGMEDQFSHVSTGGGASLEMLEGKTLPGLAALSDA